MSSSILGFLITIAILVAVHEYGHYRMALWCGVRVLRFSIGFGPVLWRRVRPSDGCEFVLSLIPMGGYVRMLDEREAPVPEPLRPMAFNRKSLRQRSAIVAAGPLANFALAVLLYALLNWVGVEQFKAVIATPPPQSVAERSGLRAGDLVEALQVGSGEWQEVKSLPDLRWRLSSVGDDDSEVRLQVLRSGGNSPRTVQLVLGEAQSRDPALRDWGLGAPYMAPVLTEVIPGGPAASAGLRAGDRILSVDGLPVDDAAALRAYIRSMPGKASLWALERGGQRMELPVQFERVTRNGQGGGLDTGRIQAMIGTDPQRVLVRWGVMDGLGQAFVHTGDVTALSLRLMGKMFTGEVSLRHLSGPLTIADVAGKSVQHGWVEFMSFLALISISIGLLNLMPLPMLDGGHLMYHFFEWVTGRPVPEHWLERLQRLGLYLLILLMSVAMFNDVLRLFEQ